MVTSTHTRVETRGCFSAASVDPTEAPCRTSNFTRRGRLQFPRRRANSASRPQSGGVSSSALLVPRWSSPREVARSRIRSQHRKPGGQSIEEEPVAPRKARETVAPDNSIAEEEEHHLHYEDAVDQNPIRPVTRVLRWLVHLTLGQPDDGQCEHRKDESDGDIEHAPPSGPGLPVRHKARDNGEYR